MNLTPMLIDDSLALTPQAGDFMSVFQRVKFPLTWLVIRHFQSHGSNTSFPSC